MGYYQSVAKQCGITLITGILAVFLVSGCVARKAENAAPKDNVLQGNEETQVPGSGEKAITAISATSGSDQLEFWVSGTQPLEYTSIKQSFPFAVSVYLPDTKLSADFVPASVSDTRVSSVKAFYADKGQTTVKIEILLNQDLPYVVKEEGNRLGIILQGAAAAETKAPISVDPAKTEAGIDDSFVIPDSPADLTHIEFDTRESGDSDIFIQTSHPVRYETKQASDGNLYLVLYNTKIPTHHQRPLLTRYFNSAVERVDPRPYPGKEGDARIDIKIREQVPFRVVQTKAGIQMSFEPSIVTPPKFGKARLGLNPKSVEAVSVSNGRKALGQQLGDHQEKERMVTEDIDTLAGLRDKDYIGEKIKLDFYDTDIKNVFRILKSVSGLNFAIDSDVEGRVTLSLDQPVPWDQVMDLVLKMNQLGKKREGNVYRIATLATIADEEKELQAAIKAKKDSMEQKKTLQPMITEYIPLSYTKANHTFRCHIIPIMSDSDDPNAPSIKCDKTTFKLRGSITFDERTNMIILTDTQEKIDKAYEIVNELDKVTPQIMIEAKVVEVTKEFSRNLGMYWGLTNDSDYTSKMVNDFAVSVNPTDNPGIYGDFAFFKLFGSSVTALNAQLEASEETGDVRIVSSPKIMTLDNKPAFIKQGQEYAYLERDDSGGATVKFKEIDLLLEVTPHVTPDKRIAMTVRVTKNDVASVTADGIPTLNTNEATTELLVDDHDTIVIGGVVKTTKRDDDDGIPFLRGIPVLGYLFSNKLKQDDRDEVLIFLTPSIIQLEQKRRGPAN